jgi:hypothetical protein
MEGLGGNAAGAPEFPAENQKNPDMRARGTRRLDELGWRETGDLVVVAREE